MRTYGFLRPLNQPFTCNASTQTLSQALSATSIPSATSQASPKVDAPNNSDQPLRPDTVPVPGSQGQSFGSEEGKPSQQAPAETSIIDTESTRGSAEGPDAEKRMNKRLRTDDQDQNDGLPESQRRKLNESEAQESIQEPALGNLDILPDPNDTQDYVGLDTRRRNPVE